jgi:hypothetical protein
MREERRVQFASLSSGEVCTVHANSIPTRRSDHKGVAIPNA